MYQEQQLDLMDYVAPVVVAQTDPEPAMTIPVVLPVLRKPSAKPTVESRLRASGYQNPNRTTTMLRNIARLFFAGEIPANSLTAEIVTRMGCPEPRAQTYATAIMEQVL
jgi:hypothetical protein